MIMFQFIVGLGIGAAGMYYGSEHVKNNWKEAREEYEQFLADKAKFDQAVANRATDLIESGKAMQFIEQQKAARQQLLMDQRVAQLNNASAAAMQQPINPQQNQPQYAQPTASYYPNY